MPTRRYTDPEGRTGTHIVSVSVVVWDDGTYTGTASAWEPGGERMRHYSLARNTCMSGVVPPGLEALAAAAQQAIELWEQGLLR